VVDDATVHWPQDRQVVELGTIKIDKVSDHNDEEQRKIIFDPVPRTEGVDVSGDPLIDIRAGVYLISGRERRAANPAADGAGEPTLDSHKAQQAVEAGWK
jgi:catalase